MRVILPIHIPETLEFRKIGLVGQYAVHFDFSDNHGTGNLQLRVSARTLSAARSARSKETKKP